MSLQQMQQNGWIRLSDRSLPRYRDNYAVALNCSEVVVSSQQRRSRIIITKYSPITNQWTKWNTKRCGHLLADLRIRRVFRMDQDRNTLFLLNEYRGKSTISSCEIDSNQWTKPSEINMVSKIPWAFPAEYEIVFVQGTCHLFVLQSSDSSTAVKHYLLDEDTVTFSEASGIELGGVGQDFFPRMHCIFVSRFNAFLLILEVHGDSTPDESLKGQIWIYDVESKVWTQKGEVPVFVNRITLSFDERHVVMVDRRNNAEMNYFFVLDISDLNHFKVLGTDIPCLDIFFKMGGGSWNEKLVTGWTRKLFKRYLFRDLAMPPLYLLQMLAQWVATEEIHYICYQGREHFVIPLQQILASTHPICESEDPLNDSVT